MNKSKKEKKEKPTYSLFSNINYIFGLQWKHSKLSFSFVLLLIPLTLGITYFDIYLPKLAIAEILNGETVNHMIIAVGSLGIIIAVFNIANKLIETYMWNVSLRFNSETIFLTQRKAL